MQLFLGDITLLSVDAIVNSAHPSLDGGGGVDGAIHKKSGPGLVAECKEIGSQKVGTSVMTNGYLLPAKKVIHTVGPVWNEDENQNDQMNQLRSCYRSSLELAINNDCKQIAFPCISTGAYKFPNQIAAEIAVDECKKYQNSIEIIFCCYMRYDYDIYEELLTKKERFTFEVDDSSNWTSELNPIKIFDNGKYVCACTNDKTTNLIITLLKMTEFLIDDGLVPSDLSNLLDNLDDNNEFKNLWYELHGVYLNYVCK